MGEQVAENSQEIGAVYIPPWIMCQKKLTLSQKVIWGRVNALTGKRGYCFASNAWIGNQIDISKGTVSNNISKLVSVGLLHREVVRDEKGEIKERRLYPAAAPLSTEKKIPINAEMDTPINAEMEGSFRDSSLRVKKKPMSGTPDPAVEVLDHLNEKAQTQFRPSKTSLKPIHGRIRDGATLDDLILVIDFKAAAWAGDEKMVQYLRPKTLFGPENFEGYLVGARAWALKGRPPLRKKTQAEVLREGMEAAREYAGVS